MINFVWKSFPRSTSMYLVEMLSHGNSEIKISARASNYISMSHRLKVKNMQLIHILEKF